jgi:diguanylate cyclase (GGDEF)-like protein
MPRGLFGSARGRMAFAVSLMLFLLLALTVAAILGIQGHRERMNTIERSSTAATIMQRARGEFLRAVASLAALASLKEHGYFLAYQQAIASSRQDLETAMAQARALGLEEDARLIQGLIDRVDSFRSQVDDAVQAYLRGEPVDANELGRRLTAEADRVIAPLDAVTDRWLTLSLEEKARLEGVLTRMLWVQVGLGGFALFIGALEAAIVVLSVTRPLLTLQASARSIAAGNLYVRVPERGPVEVASLARDFNRMADSLLKRTQELEQNLTELQQAQDTIKHMAYHDALTGLPNRHYFEDRLAQALREARQRNQRMAVLFLDLDRFKFINDTFGHTLGDHVLQQIAHRLETIIRKSDMVARVGGDEFTLLLPDASAEEAVGVAERVLQRVREPQEILGRQLHITASLGITVFPEDGQDAEALLRNADIAMYKAKEEGGDSYRLYSPSMDASMSQWLTLQSELWRALERGELLLYYQPQVDVRNGRVFGAEALVRWQHPEKGLMLPDSFIPLAEDSGLIVPLGTWVLKEACRQLRAWQEAGLPSIALTVNISARQLQRPGLVPLLGQLLEETGVEPGRLVLEVTEGAIMRDMDAAIALLKELREMGFLVSLDDFGTGHSSLNYLKALPLDILKIDRSFVRDIGKDSTGNAMVTAIVTLARSCALRVIAEGVENSEQLDFLQRLHCYEVQGFLFGRPMPAEDFGRLLRRGASVDVVTHSWRRSSPAGTEPLLPFPRASQRGGSGI